MPDEPDSSEDNGMSDSSLSDVGKVLQGKGKDKGKGKTHRKTVRSKAKTQPNGVSDAWHIYLASQPGHIPDGLSVVPHGLTHEYDNSLWGMLGRDFYYSTRSNIVYVGHTAIVALEYETQHASDYPDVNSQCLYSILSQGFPMNPHSVMRAVCFIQASKEMDQDHIKGFKLLEEF